MAKNPPALLAQPNFLSGYKREYLESVFAAISSTLRLHPKISDDDLVHYVREACRLKFLHISGIETVTVQRRQSTWNDGSGDFSAHLAWARVGYFGSAVLWKAKPPSFSWHRYGT